MSGYSKKDENKKIASESESEQDEHVSHDDEGPRPDPEASGSGVNNPIFTIHGSTSDSQEERMKEIYASLTLEEQLQVAFQMEEEVHKATVRLKWIKTSKELTKALKDQKKVSKEKVDRRVRNIIKLRVRVNGHPEWPEQTIHVNRNGKCGQIRKQIVMLIGAKANHTPFMKYGDNNGPHPNNVVIMNMNTFIYTLGINNDGVIWLIPPDQWVPADDLTAQALNAEINRALNSESEDEDEDGDGNGDEDGDEK